MTVVDRTSRVDGGRSPLTDASSLSPVGLTAATAAAQLPNFQEPVTLDFVDAELESARKLEIRASMINGENKSMTFETLVKSLDERYVDRVKRTYTWTQVESTDYSLAVVLPHYSLFHIKALLSGDEITQAAYFETLSPSSTDAMEHVFIAPRDYCKNMVPSANNNNNTEFLLNFIATIERDSPNSPDCEDVLLTLQTLHQITRAPRTHCQDQ
uniref:Voltage-dependent calcium channel subunit alpha-2/delta-1-like isoform X2 n=1 Tax=Petromyzon marinus TaxID=7757 RepID=A0AAJ7WJS3_PETMA|nr:voltage-dependent calcium channel subunit alpha-2/delta-1-like isoform X2 [Petromyzon marinus]